MKVQEALNFIIKHGWVIHRKTAHGYMMRNQTTGITVPFAYIAHSKELGATQLRMLTKKFELSPPLIDSHVEAAKEKKELVEVIRVDGKKLAPMSMRDIGWRITQAMEHIPMPDEQLAKFMGREIEWVERTKKGENKLSEEEIAALVGIFGRTADGKINTKWYVTRRRSASSARSRGTQGGPPLIPAPWVLEAERNKQLAARAPQGEAAISSVAKAIEKQKEVTHHERPVPVTTAQPATSPQAATTPATNGETKSPKESDSLVERIAAELKKIRDSQYAVGLLAQQLAQENIDLREKVRESEEVGAVFDLMNEIATRRKSKE